jgi:inorganic triphosphatase YgiF
MLGGDRSYPLEVKLTFIFPPELRSSLERHPPLQEPHARPPQEQHQLANYYDTPDLTLNERGLRYGCVRVMVGEYRR